MAEESNKPFDIVIYGGSGFTGQFVIEELCHSEEIDSIKWAVAGRNLCKLKKSLSHVQKYLKEGTDIQNTPVIYADAEDSLSLLNMCKQTKLVLNCVGPFTWYGGESVVAACIECGTHCIDISAELKYLEDVQGKYFELAREKRVYIIQACGFGSLPSDYGISLLKQKFPGDLNAVEYFVKIREGPKGRTTNIGTLLSFIQIIKDYQQSSKHADPLKAVFKKPLPPSDYPVPTRWPALFYCKEVGSLCCVYPGPDRSILRRSQMLRSEYLNERPVHSRCYYQLPSLAKSLFLLILLVVFLIMSSFSKGRKLLAKYPKFFTAGQFSITGPTRQQILEGTTQITFLGTGWQNGYKQNSKPDSKIKLTISGPEAAYPFTARCMVQAGLTVLREQDKLPLEGGVLTPGVAFERTTIRHRLEKCGVKFEIENDY